MQGKHVFFILIAILVLAVLFLMSGVRKVTAQAKTQDVQQTTYTRPLTAKADPMPHAQTETQYNDDDYSRDAYNPEASDFTLSQAPDDKTAIAEFESGQPFSDPAAPQKTQTQQRDLMAAFITSYKTKSGKVTKVLDNKEPLKVMQNGAEKQITASLFSAIATDKNNNIYIADTVERAVFKLTPAGNINMIADKIGSTLFPKEYLAAKPSMYRITVDRNDNIYISDDSLKRIFKLTQDGTLTLFAGGTPEEGKSKAQQTQLGEVCALATDSKGSVYIATQQDSCVREVSPDGSIQTILQTEPEPAAQNVLAEIAKLNDAKLPGGITILSDNSIVFADARRNRLIKIAPDKTIKTIFKVTEDPYNTGIVLKRINRITSDSKDNIYIMDSSLGAVFMLDAKGEIYFTAGNRAFPGPPQDNADSLFANMGYLNAIAIDKQDNLIIATTQDFTQGIYKITY
ncbi:hypothetical protein Dip510_000684 [Elusimicrobium posterum]|uniref:hypothetical protein n=1 Tax=Elusimicrobium posterum TaxID=3116653 RepID=UPI003C73CAC5